MTGPMERDWVKDCWVDEFYDNHTISKSSSDGNQFGNIEIAGIKILSLDLVFFFIVFIVIGFHWFRSRKANDRCMHPM